MDFMSLKAKLTLDKSEYEQGLIDAESDVSSSGNTISGILGKVGGIAGGVIKLTAAGIAAGTAAVGALTKQSTTAYAQYEQLSGGISKLFGTAGQSVEQYAEQQGKSVDEVKDKFSQLETAQSIVFKNADQAYEKAGMSANTYMEQVSGFSAALVNSLGGDTVEAAKRADVAMRAISDNVNTFGSDMSSVQMAFQGFAKQNYTMLDNLKLGYGGTKTEMERLIADANEYAEATGQAADLSIDSFADIVSAIELIQQKQNIAGTTAREAASTVEGSLNMLRGSWENLVAGFANPDADLGVLIDNVVSSAEIAFKNLLPVVERSIEGISRFITDAIPMLLDKLPDMVTEVAPKLIGSAVDLIEGVVASLNSVIPQLTKIVPDILADIIPQLESAGGSIIDTLVQTFNELAPMLFEEGINLIMGLSDSMVESIPTLIENILPTIESLSEGLREGAGTFVDVGIDFILNLAQGLMDSLPILLEQLPQIVINIAGVINDNAPKLLVGGVKLIYTIISGIISAVPALIQNFPQIFQAILAVWSALNWLDLGKNVITWIKNGVNTLKTQIPNTIKDIGKRAIEFFKGVNWSTAGSQAIQFITSAIRGLASLIPNALKAIGHTAVSAFKSINWLDLGANIIRGIVTGISSNVGAIVDAAKNAAKRAFDAAKDFLGIKSPSRLFRDAVGAMIPRGLAMGIEQTTPEAVESSEDLAKRLYSPFEDLMIPDVEIPTATVEEGGGSNIESILGAILEFLRLNWPDGDSVPIVIGGQTVGYYDRQLGMRTTLARRGVV